MSISARVDGGDELFFADVRSWNAIRGSCPGVGSVFYDALVDWGIGNGKVNKDREYGVSYDEGAFCEMVGELERMRGARYYDSEVRASIEGLLDVLTYSIGEERDVLIKSCNGKIGTVIF